jgi:hypothetical protein
MGASYPGQESLMRLVNARVALAALAGTLTSAALADVSDYEFRLLQGEMKTGEAVVAARLVNKKTGQPVPDAVIFAKRIDMAPDGMPSMAADLTMVPSADPSTYRFKTSLTMAGSWQLSLAAKVQGEAGTLQSRLILKAKD